MLQILSQEELKALTGYQRRSGVLRWLRERGWVFETSATGWPVVSARYAEQKLGGSLAEMPSRPGPNFAALNRLMGEGA